MTLDLDELLAGWDCPPGELRARTVVGRDGVELIQLRVDLGVMQMAMTDRPDGQRCRGLPTARDYIQRELRLGHGPLAAEDWKELEREVVQTNYRRVALSTLSEDALQANDRDAAERFLRQALLDTEHCLDALGLVEGAADRESENATLRPTLIFDRARLLSQLRIVEGRFEEAIEESEAGAASLEQLLGELGYDGEMRDEDPGVLYLNELGQRLRREYGITRTLREQLEEAIENEDFERAAQLHDALRQREIAAHSDEQTPPATPDNAE